MVVLMMPSFRALAIALGVAALAASSGAPPAASQTAAARTIDVTAERFEFWPSEITIDEGEQVELRITSEDTMHGFRVVGAGINVLVPKRGKGPVTARLAGVKPGRYTFECTRMCGAGHHFMRGVLVVRGSPRGNSR
jgi:cytochrome c oxidase subunit 2